MADEDEILRCAQGFGSLRGGVTIDSTVILSAAKDLYAHRESPFPFAALRASAHSLRVTLCDCSNDQGLFFTLEPCLTFIIGSLHPLLTSSLLRRLTLSIILAVTISTFFEVCIEK